MYNHYYGFQTEPFTLTPSPELVFMSEKHQEALAVLKYGVVARKGVILLTGEVGTGKTTLLQTLIHSLPASTHICLLTNPTLTRNEFFYYLAKKFNLLIDNNKARFLYEFGEFLQQCEQKGERVLLLFDEAHVLPIDLLEEIRLLSNLDILGRNVFSIFLVGQPELNERMLADRLLPLRQRIGIHFHLEPFNLDETARYIHFRLRNCGAAHLNLFSEGAIEIIFSASKGIPRLINTICDQALLLGFAEDKQILDSDLLRETIADLHFPGEKNVLPVGESFRKKRIAPSGYALYLAACAVALLLGLLIFIFYPAARKYPPLNFLFSEKKVHASQGIYSIGGESGQSIQGLDKGE